MADGTSAEVFLGNGVVLVPDDGFIFKTIEVGKKQDGKKIFDAISNEVTASFPFPIEQLAWGYLPLNAEKTQWLYFSGLRERIEGFVGEVTDSVHILPCAAVGVFVAQPDETCVLTCGSLSSTLVNQKPASCLSESEVSLSAPKFNQAVGTSEHRWMLQSAVLNGDGDCVCTLAEQGGSAQKTATIPEKVLWQADVRDKTLILKLKKQQKTARRADKGMKWAFAALFITFICQAALWAGGFVLGQKQRECKRQAEVAKHIEGEEFLAQKMRAIVEQEMRPFELLGLLNSFRPDKIYFTSATVDNLHNATVEAVSESAMLVENYTKVLRNSGYFESVKVANVHASDQGTKFQLTCDFKEQKPSAFKTLEQ